MPEKEGYRFFRDDENKREYNSAVRLLNASIWLTDIYKTNVVVNRKTYNCLDRRKDELEAALSDDNGQSKMLDFVSFMGDEETSYPEGCDGGDESSVGNQGGENTNIPGTSFGNIGAIENNMGLGNAPENEMKFQGEDNKSIGGSDGTNVEQTSGSMSSSESGSTSSTGDSSTGESSSVSGSQGGTNAKSKNSSGGKKLKLKKTRKKQ